MSMTRHPSSDYPRQTRDRSSAKADADGRRTGSNETRLLLGTIVGTENGGEDSNDEDWTSERVCERASGHVPQIQKHHHFFLRAARAWSTALVVCTRLQG